MMRLLLLDRYDVCIVHTFVAGRLDCCVGPKFGNVILMGGGARGGRPFTRAVPGVKGVMPVSLCEVGKLG